MERKYRNERAVKDKTPQQSLMETRRGALNKKKATPRVSDQFAEWESLI